MIERGRLIPNEKMTKFESNDSVYNHIYHLCDLTDRKPVRPVQPQRNLLSTEIKRRATGERVKFRNLERSDHTYDIH
jgi:hypothetical protein